MKKRIVTIALVVALVALCFGATLAYFQDTDVQENVFTIGNIKIDLFEDFNSDNLPLLPAVGTVDPVTSVSVLKNTLEKEVYVENTGDNKAYVRIHIAVPDFSLVNGTKTNVIHFICNDKTTVEGAWSWAKTAADKNYQGLAAANWNRYSTEINGIPYKVYVVTYETALKNGDVTLDAIHKVYMDSVISQDDIAAWNNAYGEGNWAKAYIVAEAIQADGFENAHQALDAGFGVPGEYDVDFTAASEGNSFVERDSLDGN